MSSMKIDMTNELAALAEPRNASELEVLVKPTATMPTLQARREALAFLHSRGMTLPDTTASAESRAAWANRHAAPKAAIVIPPRSVPTPPPPAPPPPKQDVTALERTTVEGLEILVGDVKRDAKFATTTPKADALVALVNSRRDALLATWRTTGRPTTPRMAEVISALAVACRRVMDDRRAADSARRMAGG
jgi:hypothetical protein